MLSRARARSGFGEHGSDQLVSLALQLAGRGGRGGHISNEPPTKHRPAGPLAPGHVIITAPAKSAEVRKTWRRRAPLAPSQTMRGTNGEARGPNRGGSRLPTRCDSDPISGAPRARGAGGAQPLPWGRPRLAGGLPLPYGPVRPHPPPGPDSARGGPRSPRPAPGTGGQPPPPPEVTVKPPPRAPRGGGVPAPPLLPPPLSSPPPGPFIYRHHQHARAVTQRETPQPGRGHAPPPAHWPPASPRPPPRLADEPATHAPLPRPPLPRAGRPIHRSCLRHLRKASLPVSLR